ncbi:MAG: hypothetical protein ACI8PZ_000632 [Myxococcota bacterium]|jgi:hypothetical protein
MGWTRRDLLYALGLGSAGALLPRVARASRPPLKLLIIVGSNGTVPEAWRMRADRPTDQRWTEPLPAAIDAWSPLLAPLAHHRSRLVVLDGLSNACGHATAMNEHQEGCASVLTGWRGVPAAGRSAISSGPSLDQAVAATRTTPFASLELTTAEQQVVFDAEGEPVPALYDPAVAWARLFPTTQHDPVAAALARRQHSVLDRVAGRYGAVRDRLGAEAADELELHRALVRDLELRVARLADMDCPSASIAPVTQSFGALGYQAAALEAFSELTALALSCGLTDVVTLRTGDFRPADLGAPPGDLHDAYAHAVDDSPDAVAVMQENHRRHAVAVAGLLDRLAELPSAGGSLLDDTLVLWTNELATGSHGFNGVPTVLAGATDRLNSGQYLFFPTEASIVGPVRDQPIGPPHNRMLTTVARALDLDVRQFGEPDLPGPDGPVDCTGTLSGVLRA